MRLNRRQPNHIHEASSAQTSPSGSSLNPFKTHPSSTPSSIPSSPSSLPASGLADASSIQYIQFVWQRPFMVEDVQDLLRNLAALRSRGPLIFEVRGRGGDKTKYLLGAEKEHLNKVRNTFKAQPGIRFYFAPQRHAMDEAIALKISKPVLTLNTDLAESVIRSGLAAIHQLIPGEELCLQLILGPAHCPTEITKDYPSPRSNWLDAIFGNIEKATKDELSSMRTKGEQFTFDTVIRLGATGQYAKGAIAALLAALRTMSSCGVHIQQERIAPELLNQHRIPRWKFPYQQRVSIKELSCFLLLPIGEADLPTVPGLHPKELLPPNWYKSPMKDQPDSIAKSNRTFAVSDGRELSISPKDALEHTILLGPTGSGKSTAMMSLILRDIIAGRSVIVIDPKFDLVNDILARIPEHRKADVVVIDPSDDAPVGFNPLQMHKGQDPEILADTIINIFRQVFKENWGITSADTMSAALLSLLQVRDANLMWLYPLLTDDDFRHRITLGIKDRIALRPFWKMYDNQKPGERQKNIESTLNKFRQITFRRGIRSVLGQSHPHFDLMDIFYERKIVLVPLNKGIIGSESAKLLGSLLVGYLWSMALSRAKIPPEKRHIVCLYIDELQDYISGISTDFSDALAQARGLGLAITCAHQYRAQLPPDLKGGVDANCRNKIYFGLQAADASEIAKQIPELMMEDFISLPRYSIYTNFLSDGRYTGWITAQTLPPSKPLQDPAELKAESMHRYGTPTDVIEEDYLKQIYPDTSKETEAAMDPEENAVSGRRRKSC